jgi:hypothetical protein
MAAKVSDFDTSERFFLSIPKPFHKFFLLPGAAQ